MYLLHKNLFLFTNPKSTQNNYITMIFFFCMYKDNELLKNIRNKYASETENYIKKQLNLRIIIAKIDNNTIKVFFVNNLQRIKPKRTQFLLMTI